MKKLLSLVLSIVLVLSMTAPAFAANDDAPLTDAEVYNRIIALKSEFPEGMKWTDDNTYTHSKDVGYKYVSGMALSGGGCHAFVLKVLDTVFPGITPFKYAWDSSLFSYDSIRVGDVIWEPGHVAIVLTKDATSVTVVEGNYNNKVHWGRRIGKDKLMTNNYMTAISTCRPWEVTGTTSRILVNGVEKQMEGYCLKGSNYFKLRDLAMALSDTPAKMEVTWDAINECIVVTGGESYTVVGGECKQSQETAIAYGNNTTIRWGYTYKGDYLVNPIAINGNNYFRLRDIADIFKTFDVSWDGATNTIIINTK